jgi:hypothetical protein
MTWAKHYEVECVKKKHLVISKNPKRFAALVEGLGRLILSYRVLTQRVTPKLTPATNYLSSLPTIDASKGALILEKSIDVCTKTYKYYTKGTNLVLTDKEKELYMSTVESYQRLLAVAKAKISSAATAAAAATAAVTSIMAKNAAPQAIPVEAATTRPKEVISLIEQDDDIIMVSSSSAAPIKEENTKKRPRDEEDRSLQKQPKTEDSHRHRLYLQIALDIVDSSKHHVIFTEQEKLEAEYKHRLYQNVYEYRRLCEPSTDAKLVATLDSHLKIYNYRQFPPEVEMIPAIEKRMRREIDELAALADEDYEALTLKELEEKALNMRRWTLGISESVVINTNFVAKIKAEYDRYTVLLSEHIIKQQQQAISS